MAGSNYELDMSRGSVLKNTIAFAIPLILSSLLQLLYNATDLVVVSRFAGSYAMGAVGTTGPITNLITNIGIGLSIGSSVLVAKRFGSKDDPGVFRAVHTSMFVGVVMGIVLCVVGYVLTPTLVSLMGAPEGLVYNGAVTYMRIIFLGVPGSIVYNFAAAILRSVGDTKRPLYILAGTGIVNVVLNLILVIGVKLDVAGVAIGTIAANYLSAIFAVLILLRSESVYKLILREIRVYKKELIEIVRVGLPAGIQSSFFSIANTVIQSTVNSFGAAAIAGNAAAGNIEGFIYVTMNAFYQATLTGVSQNFGAKNEKRIYKSIYVSAACVVVAGLGLGLLGVVFSKQLLGIYITDSADALSYGTIRMYTTFIPYFLCGIMEVMTGALRGLRCSTVTAVTSFIGACGFRIFWITFILPFHRTTRMLYLCWPLSWAVVILMHIITFLIIRPKAIKQMREQQ